MAGYAVGEGAAIAGDVGGVAVDLVGEQVQGAGDAWAVGGVEGDGDGPGSVGDRGEQVEEVAQNGPVFVGRRGRR